MSSPFQKAFSAKSPLHNHGNKDIERAKKLSKKDGEDGDFNYESDKVMKLKTRGEEKNASHSNSKEQTNLPSTGDEQQSIANMNYSEKKTEAVAQMRSPLHGDYYNPKAKQSTILSEVGMINKATDDVAKAAMSIANESASSKAKRQGKRVDNRNKRGVNKGEGTIDATTGVYTANNPNSKFNEKTVKISNKAEKNKTTANKNKTSNNKNTFSKWLDKNSTASQAVIDAKKASLGIT